MQCPHRAAGRAAAVVAGVAIESTTIAPTYDTGGAAFTAAFVAPPHEVSRLLGADRVDWFVTSSPTIYESAYVVATPGRQMTSAEEMSLDAAFARSAAARRVEHGLSPGPRPPSGWTAFARFPGCSPVLSSTRRVAGYVEHDNLLPAPPGPDGERLCIAGGGIRTLGLEWNIEAIGVSPARAEAFVSSFTPLQRR